MSGNAARGMVLVGLAVLIGLFILNSGFDSPEVGAVSTTSSDGDGEGFTGDEKEASTDGTDESVDGGEVTDGAVAETTDGADVDGSATTDGTADGSVSGDFTLHPPQDVRVLVGNGTEIGGAAGRAKDTLVANAYNALPPANSTLITNSTAVYFTEGYEGDAREIANLLGGTPDQVLPMPAQPPVLDLAEANVFVHLGADLAKAA